MISYLKGTIKFIGDNFVTVLGNDIGWKVNVPDVTQFEIDQQTELYIYSHFRESEISLWGFKTPDELELFQLLISVSGVGPKTGQALISSWGVKPIYLAIINNNADILKVSGVGLKTSQKIILELQNKVIKFYKNDMQKTDGAEEPAIPTGNNISEAMEALITLGYGQEEVHSFVQKFSNDQNIKEMQAQEIIKQFLKNI